jgi:hypothetical protein
MGRLWLHRAKPKARDNPRSSTEARSDSKVRRPLFGHKLKGRRVLADKNRSYQEFRS